MDENYIAYQSLVAARESATWAFWSMIGTFSGIFVGLFTIFYAARALSTWREQEKTKLKMDFKKSILALNYAVRSFPEEWSYTKVHAARIAGRYHVAGIDDEVLVAVDGFQKAWRDASDSWVMCESLLVKSVIPEKWCELEELAIKIQKGFNVKVQLLKVTKAIYTEHFIF